MRNSAATCVAAERLRAEGQLETLRPVLMRM
jgi:hypothetical protein